MKKDSTDRIVPRQPQPELENHLRHRLGTQVRDVCVLAEEQGVILQGKTRTFYAKQLAQETLLEVTPLPLLANEIEVDGQT